MAFERIGFPKNRGLLAQGAKKKLEQSGFPSVYPCLSRRNRETPLQAQPNPPT
jgi:hypothetical protein